MSGLLESTHEVVRSLLTYTDWWQRPTTFLQLVGGRRGGSGSDGLPPGFVENLDERVELCRRMQALGQRDRQLLFLWYVAQLPVPEIARRVGISRRHCFRTRGAAIRKLVQLGEPEVQPG